MTRRKDGLWEATKTINGKRIHFYGATQREVRQKMEAYEDQTNRTPTFETVADLWQADHFERIEEGSQRSYAPAVERAKARFGGIPVDEITPQDISVFLQLMGKDFAKKTVSNQKGVISMILDYAIVEMGIRMINPCDRIKVSEKLRQETRDPLTEAQRKEIQRTGPDEDQMAYVILFTGLRLGECLGLMADDIDWDRGLINVERAVHFRGNDPQIGKLKTKNAYRQVPLLPPLRKRLEELATPKGHYIIGGGTEPITQSAMTRRWEAWCRAHGLAHEEKRTPTPTNKHTTIWKPDIDRHQIRHEFATIAFEAGLEVKTVQHLLGHADYQTTMNIYTSFRERSLQDAAEKLSGYWG